MALRGDNAPVFLMCPPEHYAIAPHPVSGHANEMAVEGERVYRRDPAGFRRTAMRKWEVFRDTLVRELGAEIVEVAPRAGLKDQVFAADASISLVADDDAGVGLLSRFTYEERQAEVAAHAEVLRSYAPGRVLAHAERNIEGCGDNVYDPVRDVYWSGCTEAPTRADAGAGRSDQRAHDQLAAVTGVEVVSLLVRKPFFHIDTAVAILPRGHIMCCPDGLSERAFETLRERAFAPFGLSEEEHLIRVSRADAERYACNVVARDDRVVLPYASDELKGELKRRGYDAVVVDLREFILSGGGPHCLTNQLNERRAPSPIGERVRR